MNGNNNSNSNIRKVGEVPVFLIYLITVFGLLLLAFLLCKKFINHDTNQVRVTVAEKAVG